MLSNIKKAIEKIEKIPKDNHITVISHFDADGITSAAIFSRVLQRWDKKFSLRIVKNLEESIIKELPDKDLLIFLDLASNSLEHLKKKRNEVIILDHHEIIQDIPDNVLMINPTLDKGDMLSGSGVCYMFAKSVSRENSDLANLAVIGMIGDLMEKNISPSFDEIIKDSKTILKKGLMLYPSTRPLDRALEYSSSLFIPGVTGNYKGVLELLKEANIPRIDGRFKTLQELNEEEMSNLVTSIMLKGIESKKAQSMIGNLYLVKFFNKLEDAREFSALINACSRMDHPEVSLGFCLGNKRYKEQAEKIYAEYKQNIVSALKYITDSEKIQGKNYAIINAKDNVKDTIIGTVASIISNSPLYTEGTIIIALAYNENKIKVSARLAGREGRNVREVLNKVVVPLGGEVGGHPNAAGCLIPRENETLFIQELQKTLEL
jgi:RecJ-like exonuclease